MMDYEIFKEVVKESFLSYMPKGYQDMEVRVTPVDKVNRKLDGISLLAQNENTMISPTLYINDMYEKYSKTGYFLLKESNCQITPNRSRRWI